MDFKDYPVEFDVKFADYRFEAYAAIKNNVDSVNDRILDGAFTKTIRERQSKGLIKVFWWHRDPMGLPIHIEEDSTGLFTISQVSKTPTNAERLTLMKDKVVDKMSIGYDTIKSAPAENGVRDLMELKLYEYSPCPIAANEETFVIDVKSVDDFFGRFNDLFLKTSKLSGDMEFKPYPNEHAARLENPDKFDGETFRRKSDGTIFGSVKVPATADVIWGKLKSANKPSDYPIPQAIRFPIKRWTAEEAKKWLKDNKVDYISFEEAKPEGKEGRIISSGNRRKIVDAIAVLQELLDLSEPDRQKEKEYIKGLVEDMKLFRAKLLK